MTTEDTWSIITDKPINSEIPAYQAQSFGIQLCSVSQTNSHEIELPIHLRYQQPHDCKIYGKHVAINLGDAVIYVRTHSDGLSTTNCFHIENDDLWIENKVELKTSFQVPVGCAEDLYINARPCSPDFESLRLLVMETSDSKQGLPKLKASNFATIPQESQQGSYTFP
ncbi:hypothetical protein AVEN_67469-1 [Araneus ventricosus]|uniref:Phosphatidylinositol-glycan biosynthesis class X protein n=1 Tax=Araneus ventricosus TaxID=182803 RepID=A0A4Y2N2I3_ARAVE|nr:hypothetical protein AVEN_210716-1 [Araneus ventricosus]GBN32066.1 hypothetical protein AVEN_67469-1 [Araneus ventricosus]